METNALNSKISVSHRARAAFVYLRQSSMKQVRENKESQRLQYALADRAKALGWKTVELIDSDLGFSAGSGSQTRAGFKRLLGSVALGEVGIVFAREASRLSRNDKDWCHLIEVCQMQDTLIADDENIYDTNLMDDQLILGIKGTISVMEMNVLRMRLLQGQIEKAKRGELNSSPPPGYVVGLDNRLIKDPNIRTQDAISLVFKKFRELWSIRQTFKWFCDNNIELPLNKRVGRRDSFEWKMASHSAVANILKNPKYAGAYIYGRRQTEKKISGDRVIKKQGSFRPFDQAKVFIKDHHEGYISWETFEENLKMIKSNSLKDNNDAAAMAVRAGHGLLGGLLRCGKCGKKLHIRYWGKSGTAARYLCNGSYDIGGELRCIGFGGATVDKRFEDEIIKAISPLGVSASLLAIDQLRHQESDRVKSLELKLEQAHYETERAFEQFNRVDPKNRLVASTLETRWNEKLQIEDGLKSTIQALEAANLELSADDRKAVQLLGQNFEAVWRHPATTIDFKKKIARLAFKEIVVHMDLETKLLRFIIFWNGGTHTELSMQKPMSGAVAHKTSLEDVEIVRKMGLRYDNGAIARVLNKLGRRTGKGKVWSQTSVAHIRKTHDIGSVDLAIQNDCDILNLAQAEKYCGVSDTTLKKIIKAGLLPAVQVVAYAPLEIKKSDLDSNPAKGIIENLKRSGNLILTGDPLPIQRSLFE